MAINYAPTIDYFRCFFYIIIIITIDISAFQEATVACSELETPFSYCHGQFENSWLIQILSRTVSWYRQSNSKRYVQG